MSPYHVQIDSPYFHVMQGSLLKGKQISSLPLCLRKHKKYKKFCPKVCFEVAYDNLIEWKEVY